MLFFCPSLAENLSILTFGSKIKHTELNFIYFFPNLFIDYKTTCYTTCYTHVPFCSDNYARERGLVRVTSRATRLI